MKRVLLFFLPVILLTACLPDNDSDPSDFRPDWIGQWTCNETSGDFAPQVYGVEIVGGPNFNEVIIKGLYNQGASFEVQATVGQSNMNIPVQEEDGFLVSGNGTITNDLSRIDLNFTINDGSGSDQVTAYMVR